MSHSNQAGTMVQPHGATPALERLQPFCGEWQLEGEQFDSLVGPAAKISAVEIYEWLVGGYFLVHHFDGMVGVQEAACLEITGYEASSQSYPTRTFYSSGQTTEWRLQEKDGAWLFTGEWPIGGEPAQVRCTVRFSDGAHARTGKWEYTRDGLNWTTFWNVSATKSRGLL